MKQPPHTLILIGVFLSLLIPITGCSSHRSLPPSPPLPATENPPIYPGAQNVKTERHESEFGPWITFETGDEQEKVFEYYRNRLLKEGWKVDSWDGQPSNWLAFKYGDGPFYEFAIEVQKAPSGHASVKLAIRTIPLID